MLSSVSGQMANRIEVDIYSILSARPVPTLSTASKSRFRIAAGTTMIVLIVGIGVALIRPDILPRQVNRMPVPLPQTAQPSFKESAPPSRAVTLQLSSLTDKTLPVYAPPASPPTKRGPVHSDIRGVRITQLPSTTSVDQPSIQLPTLTESAEPVSAPVPARLTPAPSLSVPSIATTANYAPLARPIETSGPLSSAIATNEAAERVLRLQALDAVRALRKQ